MENIKGSIYAFLGTSIFAVNFISMKILVDNLPSMLIIFLRFILASISLFFLSLLLKKDLRIKSKRDLRNLIFTGFLGMSLYYILFTFSLKFITAPLASLLCSMIPILTLIYESILKKKLPEIIILILFLISLFGVYLAIDVNFINNNLTALLTGICLMFLGVSGWIIYTVKTEYLMNKYDSLVMLAYQSLFGGLINLFLSIGQLNDLQLLFFSSNARTIILNLLFTAICGSALGYYFFNLGIKYLGVTISSAYMNIMPVITIITGYIVLDTSITYRKVIGVFIVIIVTFFVTFKDRLLNKNYIV